MTSIHTHYDTLEVSRNASDLVIRAAYKSLSQRYHPDKNSDNRAAAEKVMKTINAAYDVLSDPLKRKEYDASVLDVGRSPEPGSAKPQDAPPRYAATVAEGRPSRSFVMRGVLMLLFAVSLVMLLGVFPYTLFAGELKWPYVAGILFWLGAGHYSYTKLFPSKDA